VPTFRKLPLQEIQFGKELSESLEAALKGVEGNKQLSESWHYRKLNWVTHAGILKRAALDR
jgi:hypothetical protein